MAEMVRVETKSAWLSKINWTQVVGIAVSIAAVVTGGKYDIPAEQQGMIVLAIQSIQGLVTWALKTYWTPTVTPASMAPSGQKTVTID